MTEHETDNFGGESRGSEESRPSEGVSDCHDSFGHGDFDPDRVTPGYRAGCPVKACSTGLLRISFGKRSPALFCPKHGIRLHSDTFVYWNGADKEARKTASLRSFQVRPDLAARIAMNSKHKAETHRLGFEMSEDALSWNVFVALAEARKLSDVVTFLTGYNVDEEPSLYLWGQLIDLTGAKHEGFAPLDRVRTMLENDIGRFNTEPDIMLVVDTKLIVCIEAKFGSGNPVAYESTVQSGDKPTGRYELFSRYLDGAGETTQGIIDRQQIDEVFNSQLFRNVVFASEMAVGADWHVANLASKTQWSSDKKSKHSSYDDPATRVQRYLREDVRDRFTFRTWEDLYNSVIKPEPKLKELDEYMHSKSAHFRRAFALS